MFDLFVFPLFSWIANTVTRQSTVIYKEYINHGVVSVARGALPRGRYFKALVITVTISLPRAGLLVSLPCPIICPLMRKYGARQILIRSNLCSMEFYRNPKRYRLRGSPPIAAFFRTLRLGVDLSKIKRSSGLESSQDSER
jgi:hypothetical protein